MSMPRQYFVDPRQQYMPPPQIPVYNGDPSFIPPNTNYPTGYPMPMTTQQMSQAASSSSRKLHKRSSSQDPRVRTNSNSFNFNPLAAIFGGGGHHRSSSFPENNAQHPTFRPRANSHSHSNGIPPQHNGYPQQQQQYPQQTLQVPAPAQPIQLAHSAPREPIAHDFAYPGPAQPKQGLRHRTRSFSGYTTTQPNPNQYQMPPGTYTPIQVPNGLLAPYMPAPQAHSSPGGGHRRSRTSSNPYNPNTTQSAMKTVRYSPNIVESTLNEINSFGSHRYPSVTRDTSRNRDGSTHRDSSRHRDTSTHRDTSRHRDPSLSRDPNTIHHTHQTPHHTVHTYQSQPQQFIPQPISNEHRGRESERDRDHDRDRGRDRSRGDKALQTGISEIDKYLKLLPPAKNFCWSRCTGRRKAVCIGINYTGSSSALKGCANDARHTRDFLIKYHNFRKSDIMLLTDDAQGGIDPTRKNIFDAMHWLVRSARKDDSLFFHYSGHGGQVPDKTGQEKDGMNEAIFPVDFKKTGEIIDDDLNKYLVQPLPPGCRLTAIFDSCHSGTVLDLPYLHSAHGRLRGLDHISHRARSRGAPAADIMCFASCKDDETSADTFHGGIAVGAMSYAFIKVLKEHPKMTYGDLLSYLRKTLIPKYHQKAQLSTTHPLDLNKDFVL